VKPTFPRIEINWQQAGVQCCGVPCRKEGNGPTMNAFTDSKSFSRREANSGFDSTEKGLVLRTETRRPVTQTLVCRIDLIDFCYNHGMDSRIHRHNIFLDPRASYCTILWQYTSSQSHTLALRSGLIWC
jgi:hypothetical protein